MTDLINRQMALNLAAGFGAQGVSAVLDAAQQFYEFLEGKNDKEIAPAVTTSSDQPDMFADEPKKEARAEDRVPKDPPKRTSKKVGSGQPAAASAESPATAVAAKPLTDTDVRDALVKVQTKAGTKDKVLELISKHSAGGAKSLSAVPPEKYAALIADAKAFLAA